jgi:hypothetical protein
MDLVTVTCDRDYDLMLLQAESISLFLTPCVHWVIINEEVVDLEKWKFALSPYYKNHTLKLLTLKDFKPINSSQGWVRQQILKLRISEHTTNDYLILDTKCFFVKHTDLSFWNDKIGDGKVYTLKNSAYSCWEPAAILYSKKLNLPMLEDIIFTVPFKVKIEYLKNADMDFLQECLLAHPIDGYPSEFVLYSYLARNEFKQGTGKVLKLDDISYITTIDFKNSVENHALHVLIRKSFKSKNDINIKTFGFHRNYLKTAPNKHITYINYFLKSLGFNIQFTVDTFK